jgi:adenylate kinase family enzyme
VQRIAVVGAVGSGKTTLAGALAARLRVPHTELDALRYGPHWAEVDAEAFTRLLLPRVAEKQWVIDGNHEVVRDLLWVRADKLVWLDYPLTTMLWRLISRTLKRLWRDERFAGGNREQWSRLLGRRSILAWAVRSHRRRRCHYEALLREPRYRHLHVIRLRRPAALNALVSAVLTELHETGP